MFYYILQNLSNSLKTFPDTLEDLKAILNVIASIRRMSLDVELRYKDIQEKYRTLTMYDIPVEEEEKKRAESIGEIWAELFLEAKRVDRSLVSVKKKFTVITKDQVTAFQTESNDFSAKFKTEGPGTVGTDLDKGTPIVSLLTTVPTIVTQFDSLLLSLFVCLFVCLYLLFELLFCGYCCC